MNDKILKMCKAMLDVKDNHAICPCVRFGYDINCSECPFAKLNNEDNLKCRQRPNKDNVKLAEGYLERNGGERMEEEVIYFCECCKSKMVDGICPICSFENERNDNNVSKDNK